MVRRPPRSPRNATLFPYPTLCRSWLRARPRAAAIVRLFDERLHAANTPVERVAAMSELLRRAARRRDPAADRLQGDAWLAFLDGDRASDVARPFSEGTGRVLLEGGFRRADRKSVGYGKRVSVRVYLGGRRIIKKKKPNN